MVRVLQIFSLRSRIILVYVIILGVGGLITSFIGSIIVNRTIMSQAKTKVHHDLKTANMVFNQKLDFLKKAVFFGASDRTMADALISGNLRNLSESIDRISQAAEVDFLSITDRFGKVVFRNGDKTDIGDDISDLPIIKTALNGVSAASPVIFSNEMLALENPLLAHRASISLMTENNGKTDFFNSGMVLLAACPIKDRNGRVLGVLYGGHLVNNDFSIVDQVWKLVYEGEKYQDREIGAVSLFCDNVIVSTNIKSPDGRRAVGALLPDDAREVILSQNGSTALESFLLGDKYISEYQPILNSVGVPIGVLHVGVLEKAYVSIRNKVILTFVAVASIGFFLIIFISFLITSSITRPLSEMVNVTNAVAAGNLNHVIKIRSKDEIGQLAYSFNRMISSLRKMKRELENWGNTLEQKVKQRTEELAAMQRTLMQSQRLASLGKLAAGIAHEINNPLGGILVLSSLVIEDLPEDDPHRENLQEVIKQTMRCRDIVKGLLQFSRQEQGKTEYVNINEVVSNTFSLIEKQALFHNIKVNKDFQKDLPSILGDNSQLQQVFMNVILNAVQAIGDVGELTIKTYHDKKDDMVVVDVTDTGCGIPEELIDRIFDPFFTTKEVGEGTGLGLAIAYGIVTRHNGRMSVKSKVGEGSTFTIKIPVAEKTKFSTQDQSN